MQNNKIKIPEIQIPVLEKHIWVSSSEYYELLTIKGRYEELKEMIDKIHSMSTPNEVKSIFSSLFKKKDN